MNIAVLFARNNSIYKRLPGCDVYDIARDARTWPGGTSVVAHPPCRAWGRLRTFARPRVDEKSLALFAVDSVRRFGGVLEHPAHSTLWDAAGLPLPGQRDSAGGFTYPINQNWFGHRATKATWLYVVGIEPGELPAIPFVLGEGSHVIAQHRTFANGARLVKGMPGWRPEVGKAEREHTPPVLAAWLVYVAELARASLAARAVSVG